MKPNKRKNYLLLPIFISLLQIACIAQQPEESNMLIDFGNEFDTTQVETRDASFQLIENNGKKSLVVRSGIILPNSSLILHESNENPWNLEGYYQVKADVANRGSEFIQVEMFVGNDPDGLFRWYCSNYVDLYPGESKTVSVKLSWTPWVFSPQLDVVGMRGVPGKIKTNLNLIKQISFDSRYAKSPSTFTIDNIRAVGRTEPRDTTGFFPFVDEFGQYAHKEWKGKIHNQEELKKAAKWEQKDLLANPGPTERDQYGGWTAGPKLQATGFFRTEKYNDKWWLVDPEGYLFWSVGVNCVSPRSVYTGVEFREKYFKEIPKEKSKFGQFFGVGHGASHGFYSNKSSYKTFNFYGANLLKKYGDNWLDQFRLLVHQRFRSWGLNTIGFVSDQKAAAQHKTPYVGSVWIRNTPKIEGSDGFWGKFHDVFDPGFRKAVRKSMERQKFGTGDPWCIGYFVDNELSWGSLGSLSIGVIKSPANQAAKKEFVKDLKMKYEDINALNRVWGTNHSSWDQLLTDTIPPDQSRASIDLNAFYKKIAETYFRTIKEELKRVAPHQNYLGCRFAWANNDETLRAAANNCDIISFNKYEYSVENVTLPEGVDKPILIGEFHFGALDRGMFHVGIKEALNQEDRGEKYKNYLQSALRNPLIVGAHWFQFIDEPLTGRSDGENYNVGLVDVCDSPFNELINKIRETTYQLYTYRSEFKK